MKSKALFYAENEGETFELNGAKVESFYCCTHEDKVCVCWLKVQNKNPYRLFVENANACFFEQFSFQDFKDEIEDFKEEQELIDLVEKLKLKDKVIHRIYIESDKKEFTFINLVIEFETGERFMLQDKDHFVGEKDSKIIFKTEDNQTII